MSTSGLHMLWRDRSVLQRFRTGISLHSHTQHSRENLSFIPQYSAKVPFLASVIHHQEQCYEARHGGKLNFSKAYWLPPLAPREAYELERQQIETQLDLTGFVSITDHDDIEAGSLLRVFEQMGPIPISVEWTVPFGPSFFHIGIHNLPPQHARSTMTAFAEFTKGPLRQRLGELLTAVNEFKETLVVLNHPLWDEAGIGTVEHAQLLGCLLERHGRQIHALELNGFRPPKENTAVRWVAQHSGHPVISGGDRHGAEPNAIINLTNAATFAEFVSEVRDDRMSDVLFLPQYDEPMRLRVIETMWDIVRDYPERTSGRWRWSDRVFYEWPDGRVQAVSSIWNGNEPWPIRYFLSSLRVIKSQGLRNALRVALADLQGARL